MMELYFSSHLLPSEPIFVSVDLIFSLQKDGTQFCTACVHVATPKRKPVSQLYVHNFMFMTYFDEHLRSSLSHDVDLLQGKWKINKEVQYAF